MNATLISSLSPTVCVNPIPFHYGNLGFKQFLISENFTPKQPSTVERIVSQNLETGKVLPFPIFFLSIPKPVERIVFNFEVMESRYESVKFKEVLKQSKEYLLRLNDEKRSEIIKEVLKNPNFDDTDVYYLTMIEIQDPSYKPPTFVVPKKPEPHKIRLLMSGTQCPTKPVWEEENASKKTEKMGQKRPRYSIDCEFDDEEEDEYYGDIKKRPKKKKKKVNNLVQERMVVYSENMPDLPDGFKQRIRNLGGTEPILVIQKKLTSTDVRNSHGRISLPRGELIDKKLLRGERREEAMLIAENGMEHKTDVRTWNGIYNVVKGWNAVKNEHQLVKNLVVQFWSFRVEGKLWLALVKLWMVEDANAQETNS